MTPPAVETLEGDVVELVRRVTGPQEKPYTCPLDGCLIVPLVDRACPVCGVPVRHVPRTSLVKSADSERAPR